MQSDQHWNRFEGITGKASDTEVSKVTWCFTPSQPLRLYKGDLIPLISDRVRNLTVKNVFRHEVSDAVYDMRHNITAGQVRPVDTKRVQKSTVKPKMSSGTRQVS